MVAESAAQRYVVVVFDGVSLGIMSFAFGVFDLARHYGALPDIDIKVVAGETQAALTGGGLACPVPYDLDAIRTADLVIIPNWRDPAEPPPPPLLESLRAAHALGARVAGLCSGAFVLAAAGLLDDRPATTHWALAGTMARMYPKVHVQPGLLFIDDGDVLTAGGGAAGMDLGLHLLRAHCGAEVADRLARLPVEEVARRCGFSSAAALRPHFRRFTGSAPAAYRSTFGGA
jgi:transcriptional regulator GlxA family with amidase domain